MEVNKVMIGLQSPRYLCDKKADYGAITHGDIQTPLHYAAKNDAPAACKVLVEQGLLFSLCLPDIFQERNHQLLFNYRFMGK